MKKKVLTVLLAGAMAASMAAGATVVSAADDDNTLTIWAWDQNFNIKVHADRSRSVRRQTMQDFQLDSH